MGFSFNVIRSSSDGGKGKCGISSNDSYLNGVELILEPELDSGVTGIPGVGVEGGISSWEEFSEWFADWLLRLDWLSCDDDELCLSFGGFRVGFFLGGAFEMQFWQYHFPRGYCKWDGSLYYLCN